jgi:hypothetical protein
LADSTFPRNRPVKNWIVENVRFYVFDDAVFNGRLLSRAAIQRTNDAGINELGYILGCKANGCVCRSAWCLFRARWRTN